MSSKKKPSRKTPVSELPGLLLGWIFIIAVLFGITFMILNAKPQPKLICDPSKRGASLTQFGTCYPVP